ncbi:DNA/RNA-binding domain E.t1.c1-type [Penicillium argentinense]|uniref:DNA/RNA-binding domain E.t1.c1-type n=1 Tax=Penicillium argentinense TaxID=1131581 RepID=A0A9W9KAZ7_9EURO|nr:DNA/RNA-binding domain E.t1.c1-type [Penicillium argentinense]KAJ5099508.1 DNA/RNA-binding domain E.t1.c1-type [Penicillium argentinense]
MNPGKFCPVRVAVAEPPLTRHSSPGRSLRRGIPGRPELSMASRGFRPASPPYSSGRQSGLIPDDCTQETLSSRGGRVTKPSSPRTSVTRTDRFRRKPSTPRGRRTPSTTQHQVQTQLLNQNQTQSQNQSNSQSQSQTRSRRARYEEAAESARSGERNYVHSHGDPRAELKRYNSMPNVVLSPNGGDDQGGEMELDEPPSKQLKVSPTVKHPASQGQEQEQEQEKEQKMLSADSPAPHSQYAMVKQLDTNPIGDDQLAQEVRTIYRGLAMVEHKCMKIDKEQAESKAELSAPQWQALISIHSTLLHEHHDFFLASQHPTAKPELKMLAEKYSMPARMWRYGIHSFLEVLRQRLPGSLEYMLNFIYVAYSMVTLLLENIPDFQETWIECLGDLARYRMAIEESDMRDREVWAAVSRYWYNQDADLSPDVGRIQHHLAVLARPDVLAQLFYYTKALVCVRPFPNARESIILLFSGFRGQQYTLAPALIATHSVIFNKGSPTQFVTLANNYLAILRRDIPRLDRKGQEGVFVMSSNFAAILQYGEPERVMAMEFSQTQHTAETAYELALHWTGNDNTEMIHNPAEVISQALSETAIRGSALAFHSLSIFLDYWNDQSAHPGIHTSLAFIWCLAIHPLAMQQLEPMIPWLKIVQYLNTQFLPDTNLEAIARNSYPELGDGLPRQLPEDFFIRGQSWSQLYYSATFFDGAPPEEDRPFIEKSGMDRPRRHRCLWLGVRISTFNRWITYNCLRPEKFEATQLAHDYAPFAATCGGLDSKS